MEKARMMLGMTSDERWGSTGPRSLKDKSRVCMINARTQTYHCYCESKPGSEHSATLGLPLSSNTIKRLAVTEKQEKTTVQLHFRSA